SFFQALGYLPAQRCDGPEVRVDAARDKHLRCPLSHYETSSTPCNSCSHGVGVRDRLAYWCKEDVCRQKGIGYRGWGLCGVLTPAFHYQDRGLTTDGMDGSG